MTNPVTIHREGEEGVIQVDAQSGMILTPIDERPEWSEGLATALLQDRLTFYMKRMGQGSADYKAIAAATTIEFADIDFIGVDAAGDEITVAHDPEYRGEIIAKSLGIDSEEGTGLSEGALAEREVSVQNLGRSQTEINALDESIQEGFGGEGQKQSSKQTGTSR